MAENKLSYLNRNFDDYRKGIIEITRQYYPDIFDNLDDASIGRWLVDVLSDIGDNLNYHIDKSVQETSLDSANEFSSLLSIARTNGVKIPYKKSAIVEVEISCDLPLNGQGSDSEGDMSQADENYAPYIKAGTKFSNGLTTFELTNDINFKEQFDENGDSNLQIIPNRNSNGNIISFTYKKLGIASASQMKVMKRVITSSDIKPFMEIILTDSNVIGVESIIVKDGSDINTDPQIKEFFVDSEEYEEPTSKNKITRFFEVDNLADQYRFGHEHDQKTSDNYYNPVWEEEKIPNSETTVKKIAKGKWKRLKHKFVTEYTDDWKLKIIFGPGVEDSNGEIPDDAKAFTKYQMSKMMANDYLGVLPKQDTTMYILYRTGGGEISNIAKGTLNNIIGLNISIDGNCNDAENNDKIRDVRRSLRVTNTTPSYGGKDAPTAEEIKYLIKYNVSAQNRCVTLKDYHAILDQMPAKYGCPFRYELVEENNKIIMYALGLDNEGHLMKPLSEYVAENIKEYLSNFKTLNDFIEIKSGKIINLSFRLSVYVDKTYDKSEVTKRIIDAVYDYMDIRKHMMGEDIFIGDLQKEISKLDGVINVVNFRIYNKVDEGYSTDVVTQEMVNQSECGSEVDYYEEEETENNRIDLNKSDYMLFGEANSMFEIKYKEKDIIVEVKVRN